VSLNARSKRMRRRSTGDPATAEGAIKGIVGAICQRYGAKIYETCGPCASAWSARRRTRPFVASLLEAQIQSTHILLPHTYVYTTPSLPGNIVIHEFRVHFHSSTCCLLSQREQWTLPLPINHRLYWLYGPSLLRNTSLRWVLCS
jgi:hypothetical protein